MRAGAGVSTAILGAGVALCLLAYWPAFQRHPRYFDYDDATQGIFANDLSFRGDYAASFREGRTRQDRYRASWAAQRLPYSFAVSRIQRLLGVPRHAIEDLLQACGFAFGLAGSLLAARCLSAPPRRLGAEAAAVVGLTAAHPSFILFLRTGASYYLLAFALFWAAASAALRYAETRRPGPLYALGGVLAGCALCFYPPLACAPVAVLAILAIGGALGPALRDRHLYAAAAGSVLAAAACAAALALAYEGSLGSFLERWLEFRRDRGHALSLAQWSEWSLLDKLTKLLDQHFLSAFDTLGDWSREDEVWTMGAPNVAFLLCVPLLLSGVYQGVRRREGPALRAAAVVGSFALVFLTVSFPEGRYLLALVPCYGFFVVRGTGALLGSGSARGSESARRAALGALLLLVGANTHYNLRSAYEPMIERVWRPYQGLREAAPLLSHFEEPLRVRTPHRRRNFKPELYFRMVMPDGARWVDDLERAGRAPGVRPVAIEDASRAPRIAELEARGFEPLGAFAARGSGRRMVVLTRPPRGVEHR